MKRHFLFLAPLALLSACATYGPNNFFTGGYNHMRLAPDIFRITFQGSEWSGAQQAQDFCILHAADVTVQSGFSHFAILGSSEGALTGSVTTPGRIYSQGYVAGNNYYGTSTYVPGATLTFVHPRSGLVIKCFRGKPENVPALDARVLRKSIRAGLSFISTALSGRPANGSNQGMELTATRRKFTFQMTKLRPLRATLALGSGSSSCSR